MKIPLTAIFSVFLLQYSSGAGVAASQTVSWQINRVENLAGYPTETLGDPQVVDFKTGRAVCFDGIDDGLLVDANPLADASAFTIEVIFRPDSSYPANIAQRFIHIQDPANEARRILLELRLTDDHQWYLDTFIKSENSSLALMDDKRRYPVNKWYHVAMVYINGLMTSYVNGVKQLSGKVDYVPISGAKTSIGTRMNRHSWFRGCIKELRVTRRALSSDEFNTGLRKDDSSYTPPLGIPAPAFGIGETHLMYQDQLYDFGQGPEPYRDAGNGPYTHYVNNQHPAATDVNNPFGIPEKPRLTIPSNLTPGSVVEIHHGPYTNVEAIHGGTYLPLVNLNGSEEKPIFLRGPDSEDKFEIGALEGNNEILLRYASYVIMENVLINGPALKIYQPTNGFALRHSEVTGELSSGINIWTWKTEFSKGELKQNIVIYDNLIHDNGPYPATEETGRHGIMIDDATRNVWILDNHIYNNGDDGIHILDRYWIDTIGPNADRIFIGRNEIHHDGENAIDVKGSSNVILSQNKLYGYKIIMPSSWGDAIRINDEGDQDNIWIIFNEIYDSRWGIAPYNSLFPPYIIGNIIYNCTEAITWGGQIVINNVISDCEQGIGDADEVSNNILTAISGDPIGNNTGLKRNNILWQNGSSETCTDCIYQDPLFLAPDQRDFRLQSGSPAIDAGVGHDIYDTYFELYGVDIKVDFDGVARPRQSGWDIGPFEYSPETGFEEKGETLPAEFGLMNYPNPFNPATNIKFELPASTKVKLEIFNISGQKIITLADRYFTPGSHELLWNGHDEHDLQVSSGLYVCLLSADEQKFAQKMLLLK